MGAQFITTIDIIKKLRVVREKESKSKGLNEDGIKIYKI